MGLLDDAIREHLELKRRSGEDARKLAQLEHEAFGPIRRGDPAIDLQPPGAAAAAEDAPVADREASDAGLFADEPVAREVAPPAERPRATPEPVAEPPAPAYEPPAPADEAPPVAREPEPPRPEPAYEPVAPTAPEPAAAAPAADQPTQAFSLDDLEAMGGAPAPPAAPPADPPARAPEPAPLAPRDVVPADEEPGEHDVLEDTPEFLEETPEHDRLWFEQKPPRDFEF
ncbi:hypothetical protein GKE82_13785 [Conexibacter sp. W3-3-2]|uniref:hypothetical protein n=1 Tax=Conexibacter sp. W3-3-2 TaxID=2675227 RepID=UPI0012B947F5|nr:hypothetical protein [Conexibacter sp. W3-3-2]MTD45327.1 hypothetical protein [Conexibacter sp. W3-3-2]